MKSTIDVTNIPMIRYMLSMEQQMLMEYLNRGETFRFRELQKKLSVGYMDVKNEYGYKAK